MTVKRNATKDIMAKIDLQFTNDVEFIVEKIAEYHGEEDPPTSKLTMRDCPLLMGKGDVSKAVAASIMAGNAFTSGKTAEALKTLRDESTVERYWHYVQGQLMVYKLVYEAAGVHEKAADAYDWYYLINDD